MKTLRKILLAALLTLSIATLAPAPEAKAQEGYVASVSSFFEPLAQYGDWYYTQQYGWVWTPYGVHSTWRPYTVGHWVSTDSYGWMWVSEEPWAWAAYHYGRWTWLDGVWVWVPDTMWGPAWVAWAYQDSYVGWAPLPPGVAVNAWTGTVNVNVNIGYNYWTYVPAAYLLEVNLYPYYLPPNRVQVIWRHAIPSTRYRVVNGTVACVGVSTVWVGGWLGYSVPMVNIVWTNTPGAYYRQGSVYVYRQPPPPRPAYRYAPPPAQRAAPPTMRHSVSQPPPPPRAGYSQPAAPPPAATRPPTSNGRYGGSTAPPPPQKSVAPAPSTSPRSRSMGTPQRTSPSAAPPAPRTQPVGQVSSAPESQHRAAVSSTRATTAAKPASKPAARTEAARQSADRSAALSQARGQAQSSRQNR